MKTNIDEAAVWQRVTAAGGKDPWASQSSSHTGLLTALQEGSALYQGLTTLYGCTRKRQFSLLAGQQRQENLRLKGLYHLKTDASPTVNPPKSGTWTIRALVDAQQAHLNTLRDLQDQGDDSLGRILRSAEERFDALLELLGQGL